MRSGRGHAKGTPVVAALSLAALYLTVSIAGAATLVVGPGEDYKAPSDAAKKAKNGDTIDIKPLNGGYYDCAVWHASHLTIEGVGDGVIITDTTCQGKALFVTAGDDITIRNLTFQRARVPDGNGAGIRAQGIDLRVEHSHFINNEVGILAAAAPTGTITILDSDFTDNGRCDPNCLAAFSTGGLALLHIEHSTFKETRGGDHIDSSALRTELIGDTITDGANGTARYLVLIPNGGSLVMRDNVLEKGPRASDREVVVKIMARAGAQPVQELIFSRNRVTNDAGGDALFVENWSGTYPIFDANVLDSTTTPVSSSGYTWFWIKAVLRTAYSSAIEYKDSVRHLAKMAVTSAMFWRH
jgi:hypothetical protein